MSRSVRRRAWRGVGGGASQRFEKRHATRRLRGAVHEALHRGSDPLPVRFEVSCRWWWGKGSRIPVERAGPWTRRK
ncbi:MAG TPA: hypothetical protein VGX21_03200 [Methylomirabilota bacterium]|nr:hypothetical protein [Methylomirabilota bacterium]